MISGLLRRIRRPPWRTIVPLAAILLVFGVWYLLWTPGVEIRDGRHDRRSNGIWLQHGWLGDDAWFARYGRQPGLFRDPAKIQALTDRLATHGIQYAFPHLCPCRPDGRIPEVDPAQTERFLDQCGNVQILPWIGGILDENCLLDSPRWRQAFVASAVDLLAAHPRLAGVQINIEPLPSGHAEFLTLLEELRVALPPGKLLSVAAYPPPSRWHPHPSVHWEEGYFRKVARRSDLVAVMMYDTALRWAKPYEALVRDWTIETLNWAGDTTVLLGVPAYDDADSGYHNPTVENLSHSIAGIHAGLATFKSLPPNYRGICIYSDWEMTDDEWSYVGESFGARGDQLTTKPRN